METPQCESSLLNEFLDIFEKEIDIMAIKELFFHQGKPCMNVSKEKEQKPFIISDVLTKFLLKCTYLHKDIYGFNICEQIFSDLDLNISYLLIVFFL